MTPLAQLTALIADYDTSGQSPDEFAQALLDALPGMLPDLVWEHDGNRIRMDDTMMFDKGYNYDGLEMFRQEAYGHGANYLIWPDAITSDQFSLYCDLDGLYIQSLSEIEAQAAANAHHRATWIAQLVPTDSTGGA